MKEIVKCVAVIAAGIVTCLAISADVDLAVITIPMFGIIAVLVSR